ncbi:MAG: hypothetical protein IH888_12505 [Planctomycetes bacterium]|nr:hypothetical protein [Planctomycetota bacterium]
MPLLRRQVPAGEPLLDLLDGKRPLQQTGRCLLPRRVGRIVQLLNKKLQRLNGSIGRHRRGASAGGLRAITRSRRGARMTE